MPLIGNNQVEPDLQKALLDTMRMMNIENDKYYQKYKNLYIRDIHPL
jgi:hypothetical protein